MLFSVIEHGMTPFHFQTALKSQLRFVLLYGSLKTQWRHTVLYKWTMHVFLCFSTSYCKPEISNVCNVVEGHCLQAMKIVHYYVNTCFDWLIFGQQSDNLLREAISILSGKYKRFRFCCRMFWKNSFIFSWISLFMLATFREILQMMIWWFREIFQMKRRQRKQTGSRQDKTVLSEHSTTWSLLNRQASFRFRFVRPVMETRPKHQVIKYSPGRISNKLQTNWLRLLTFTKR